MNRALRILQTSHALPIAEVLPAIREACAAGENVVVQAPPGSGKTTLLPLALLEEAWAAGGKLIILEPRRLAARMAARRMASMLGEAVGETVGYRVRLESRVGPDTRIELHTDGVFLRHLQQDPGLAGIAAVLFDEVHERGIESDLALALCREAQSALRPDLRLIAMSATLDPAPLVRVLGNTRVVECTGRSFPVETRWLPPGPAARLDQSVANAVIQALHEAEGDILVFLPGIADIRRVEGRLAGAGLPGDTSVMPLYGDLSAAAQDAAVQPSPPGKRKIVLATSIAESSLTIEGVRVVVDSGYMRQQKFSPRTGMSGLETVRVSHAAAEQRRGRAGRVAPGICYRLWAEASHGGLAKFTSPEILMADLAPLALDLARWGARTPQDLAWLDPPPAPALAQARSLLTGLGALDPSGAITGHGRAMADLPLHPRLAHMVLQGQARGLGGLACALAALLSERDIVRREARGPGDADLRWRLDLLLRPVGRALPAGMRADETALRQVRQLADIWRRRIGAAKHEGDCDGAGLLVALAFPDRISRRRDGTVASFLMSGGRGAKVDELDPLAREGFLAIAELDAAQADARVFLAAPISEAEIEAELPNLIESRDSVTWDDREQAVMARRQRRLGAVILKDQALARPDPALVTGALLEGISKAGSEALPWTDVLRQWQARVQLLRRVLPEAQDWPDVGDASLISRLADWLGPHLEGLTRVSQLSGVAFAHALTGQLSHRQNQLLASEAPTHWRVPTGSLIPIDYAHAEQPVLAVRLQEMFGEQATPTIAGGRVKIVLHLLSPARRPLQVTSDLKGFWASSYRSVRAEMRGQYPKHEWPEDPLRAVPTARAKPRPPR